MAKRKMPCFRSLREERQFWQTHDVFDVLGEDGWEIVEPGEVEVESIYVSRLDRNGATLRVPKEALARLGVKAGARIQARVEGRKLVIERST